MPTRQNRPSSGEQMFMNVLSVMVIDFKALLWYTNFRIEWRSHKNKENGMITYGNH